jgi:RimJ/RimL family protein N-acetyltransferase
MLLLPIKETAEENSVFICNPDCIETIYSTIEFYKKVGFTPPWIGYYASENNELVGSAAFKGKPANNTVEIAYSTMKHKRQQGAGTRICRALVELALQADPMVRITARTLPEHNFSTRILQKNNFVFTGVVNDPEDGEVWEWEYRNP